MDKPQYKTLKKINKSKLYEYTNSNDEEFEIIRFLAGCGYIRYEDDENETSRRPEKKLCRTTQAGKAALYDWWMQRYSIKVPIAISIFAAIGGYRQELALVIQVIEMLWKWLTAN